jgi:hypothetical protein
MTAEVFNLFWAANYPETIPIPHYFRHDYPDRWFRIHSLPQSKRYADNDQEWDILLSRQNQIITDLIGENANFLLVTGEHKHEDYTELHPIAKVDSIVQIPFVLLDKMDLNKISPDEYEPGAFYYPMCSEQTWIPRKFDDLLREIADDKLRVIFISIDNELMIAPYDGGVDFILKNSETRDSYKQKYADWLSERQDGL